MDTKRHTQEHMSSGQSGDRSAADQQRKEDTKIAGKPGGETAKESERQTDKGEAAAGKPGGREQSSTER